MSRLANTISTAVFLAGLAMLPQSASAACQSCLNLNLPSYPVQAVQDDLAANGQSLVLITLSGVGTGYDVQDGVGYKGWCGEKESTSFSFQTSTTLYSSYNPALPGGIANVN